MPTPVDGSQTRQRLLDATTAVIVERGWGGASTRAVADRAGVKPGVVHYHFGSVDDLKRRASMETLHGMFEPFLAAAREMPPRAMVTEIARASVEEYGPETEMAALIYEVLPAAARDPELQAGMRDLLERFRAVLADAIRRWHPEAVVEPEVLAEVLGAVIDGLQLHLLAEPELDLTAHLEPLFILLGPEASA